jgi:nicotinamidase-related amidase
MPKWLERWHTGLDPAPLDIVIDSPETTAIFAVDMVIGMCTFGPLSSQRVGALAEPVANLMQQMHDHGVRDFVLIQDTHDPAALEFATYPRHNVRFSAEADTIPKLKELPFADTFTVLPKNSLHPAVGTGLNRWLAENSRINTVVVVGAGTDLSVYQTAMHLRLRANDMNLTDFRVVVPANAVDTYNLSPMIAQMEGKMPHVADFFQPVFLYHLAFNGVEVVASLGPEKRGS